MHVRKENLVFAHVRPEMRKLGISYKQLTLVLFFE